jgi:hypothetical protein
MAPYTQFHEQPIGFDLNQSNFTSYYWSFDQLHLQPTIYDESNFMGRPQQVYGQQSNDTCPFNSEQLSWYDAAQHNFPPKAGYLIAYQPPMLSSTLGSDVSTQSAMNSNTGSPSPQPQQGNDWDCFDTCLGQFQRGNNISTFVSESGTTTGDFKHRCFGEFIQIFPFHDTSLSTIKLAYF